MRRSFTERKAMQYLLMIHQDEKVMQAASKEEASARFAAYGSYVNAMKEAGAYVGGERLHPSSTATVVRAKNGKTQVRPLCRCQGTARRLLSHRGARPRKAVAWAARRPAGETGAIEVQLISDDVSGVRGALRGE
jgi:hypothetical protein